ncbi:hypothetical protein [Streptomyces canus]|uniref:hypothetical protein n=1 Tax=Streptomyces canus TaxID=58343 RepID=UPI00384B49F3
MSVSLPFPWSWPGWGVPDVLRDRLTRLGVPVLGGLPAGHGLHATTIPLGICRTTAA